MALRRPHSTNKPASDKQPSMTNGSRSEAEHDSEHDHEHEHEHEHTHSHSFFGHSHGVDEHSHGAENIVAAFQRGTERGSRITIIGLFSNIGLTATKGVAGWYLHSASLLADAGHSLSDLLGDFTTLICWRLSRRPPSERYPFGFSKFETLGTTAVSLSLIGGALGIGFHSYHLFLSTLSDAAASLPVGALQEVLTNVTNMAPPAPTIIGHAHHAHGHVEAVDPNAAWFAAISIVIKEWLYRVTKRVADTENSSVLLANAIHHRSDAYSSLVAFFAILGSWWFPKLPLDPIGGLLVSAVILRQGIGLLLGAWGDLTDAGVSRKTRHSLKRILDPLVSTSVENTSPTTLLGVRDLRARRSGSMMFVDLTAEVPGGLSVDDASLLDDKITDALKKGRREVSEVRIKFVPVDKPS